MATIKSSLKHVQIDKANSSMVIAVSIAVFVVVFAGLLSHFLLVQRSYQQRVTAVKQETKDQLDVNVEAAKKLNESFVAFVDTSANVIGGSTSGAGERDGDNARIVLDSLPSKYDFPALTSSLEKIINNEALRITEVRGTDEELSLLGLGEGSTQTQPSSVPEISTSAEGPTEIPFGVSVEGSYDQVQSLIGAFERSIRPFHIISLSLSGDEGALTLTLDAKTYFQPERIFRIDYEVVK